LTQCPVSLTFTPLTLAEWNADAFVRNLPYAEPQLFFLGLRSVEKTSSDEVKRLYVINV